MLEHQRAWLPSNLLSIASAQFYPDNFCRAIFAGEQLAGFGMYGVEQQTQRVKVFRLMIAGAIQRRGYGTAAMIEMLNEIVQRFPSRRIYVSYQNGNMVARRLYGRLGFNEVERAGDKITAARSSPV